jgi:hypothetical protein
MFEGKSEIEIESQIKNHRWICSVVFNIGVALLRDLKKGR